MRVAIVSPWAIPKSAIGGTERFCVDLAEQLQKRGHNVSIFTLTGQSYIANGVRYVSLDIQGTNTAASEYDLQAVLGDFSKSAAYDNLAKRVESKLDASNFDVIHVNSLLLLRAWRNSRRIFTLHTNPYEFTLDWGEAAWQQAITLLRIEVRQGEVTLIAPSRYYATIFKNLVSHPVRVVPHALKVSRLASNLRADHLRRDYGMSPDKITLLLPSRLELNQKRPQVAFRALANLPSAQRSKFQIVCSGLDEQYFEVRNKLQAIANKSGIETHFVHFKTMADAYAMADIVGLTSCSESFGYAALESLSLQKPTIINSIATYREIGAGNPNAYFFRRTARSFEGIVSMLLAQNISVHPNTEGWVERYDIDCWADRYQTIMQDDGLIQ